MSSQNSTFAKANTVFWDKRRAKIETSIGKWIGGEDVICHGHSLFNDLFNQISYMQMIVLNVTGRLISTQLSTWLESNFMVMSYPDARIWCNQVGALCGNTGTTPSAATVAGSLAADSRVYGGSQTSKIAMSYIMQALKQYQQGKSIEELVNAAPVKQGKPAIVGFARPVARNDERIGPHRKMSQELGFDIGEHMALANQLDDYMLKHYSMGINIGGYTSAFMADQGFSPDEVYRIKSICVASGVTACYVDNLQHRETAFLPQTCQDVEYTGPELRQVPNI